MNSLTKTQQGHELAYQLGEKKRQLEENDYEYTKGTITNKTRVENEIVIVSQYTNLVRQILEKNNN